MLFSPELAGQLATLTAVLDDPDIDLEQMLEQLHRAAGTAVDSYLGLSVVLGTGEQQVVLGVLDRAVLPAQVATSLHLSMAGSAPGAAVAFVLYAGAAGAFVDLAADLDWLWATQHGLVRVDEHRELPWSATRNLDELVAQDRAIGLLIGRGLTPEQADAEIDALARSTGTNRRAVAELLLPDPDEPEA